MPGESLLGYYSAVKAIAATPAQKTFGPRTASAGQFPGSQAFALLDPIEASYWPAKPLGLRACALPISDPLDLAREASSAVLSDRQFAAVRRQ
jgi:hypothetical protein